ncbi:MAG: hypothetical protein K2Y27_07915 [Xanthobacteraceae bacterium]|nr:hypothetical protein [Xanthobacteraceae bacterium]
MNGPQQRALTRKLDLMRVKGARLLKLAKRDERGFAWFITPSVELGEDEARQIIARPDIVVANRDVNGVPNAWMVGA